VIFQKEGQVVLVTEIINENDYLNCIPVIAMSVINEHQILLDVVVFLKAGNLPKSRLGEKQRGKIAKAYLLGKL